MLEYRLLKWSGERCLCLFSRGFRPQTTHHSQPPDACAARVCAFTGDLRFPCERDRDILRGADLRRSRKTRRSHTRDRKCDVIDIDLLADDRRIGAKTVGPKTV